VLTGFIPARPLLYGEVNKMTLEIPKFVPQGPYPNVGIKKLVEDFRAYLEQLQAMTVNILEGLQGNYLLSLPELAAGSTPANVANVAFDFQIAGVKYSKAAIAAGTALAGDDIPQAAYGAWQLEIGDDGTVDIVAAAANAVGYASADLAIAGLPVVSEGHALMGFVTAINSDAVFSPGVTSLAAATVTATFTDGPTVFQAIG
jgi:hypothetical protein